MPTIICYLVREGFNTELRYAISNGQQVSENKASVFDVDVSIDDAVIRGHIEKEKKLKPKIIHRAKSSFEVYYRNDPATPPEWVRFWNVADTITVRTADAIAFIETSGRYFAVCHGHSSHLLNPYAVEYDFGLRTALNLIDKGSVRSTDLLTPSDLEMKTRKQAVVGVDFEQYGINVLNTILKNITGKVQKKYRTLFESVNGAESIKFNHKEDPPKLIDTLGEVLGHYKSDSYKRNGFDFVDNFAPIKDPALLDSFESMLIDALNNRDKSLALSIPSSLNYDGIFDFRFRSLGESKRRVFDNLDVETTLFNILDETGKVLANREDYHAIRLEIVDHDNQKSIIEHFPLSSCIYWEQKYKGKTYFLESGVWYQVNTAYIAMIEASVKDIIDNATGLKLVFDKSALRANYRGTGKAMMYENWFNIELVSHLTANGMTALLLDRKTVTLRGRTPIEVCDVLATGVAGEYELIHVKYKYGSSALSHMLSQGSVSAEMLMDPSFRVAANRKIQNPALKFPKDDTYDPRAYTVAYGIISKKSSSGSFSIPLFSKINLKVFLDNLYRMRYKAKLIIINEK